MTRLFILYYIIPRSFIITSPFIYRILTLIYSFLQRNFFLFLKKIKKELRYCGFVLLLGPH